MFIELKKTFYFALLDNVHEKYYDYEKHINENINYNMIHIGNISYKIT